MPNPHFSIVKPHVNWMMQEISFIVVFLPVDKISSRLGKLPGTMEISLHAKLPGLQLTCHTGGSIMQGHTNGPDCA